jgi:hypothetical protein
MQQPAALSHNRWQVHIGWHFDEELWVDMPLAATPMLEMAARAGAIGPIQLRTCPGYTYVFGEFPTQFNLETGMPRRMRRVIICVAPVGDFNVALSVRLGALSRSNLSDDAAQLR